MTTWLWMAAVIYANLVLTALAQASTVKPQDRLVVVNIGETVVLHCFYEDGNKGPYLSWYKQASGDKPRLVSSSMKHTMPVKLYHEFENNPRFSVGSGEGVNHLKITDVRSSDSATYYCGMSLYIVEFEKGIMLLVNSTVVRQSLVTSVQPGHSVILNCTVQTEICDGKHSVHWFRSSGESQPGVIYTHKGSYENCTRSYDNETPTHTCIYHLSKRNLSRSDAGTYYCAVSSCGEIWYGNRTMLEIKEDDCCRQMRMLVFLSISRTVFVFCCVFTLTIFYMTRKRYRLRMLH